MENKGEEKESINYITRELDLESGIGFQRSNDERGSLVCIGETEYERRGVHCQTPYTPINIDVGPDMTSYLLSDIDSPLLPRGPVHTDMQQPHPILEGKREKMFHTLRYMAILAHLGVFGIIGIFIRYSLQVLFGPDVAKVTDDHTPLYVDLPSNMVGSFFIGWVGIVFKSDISLYSEFMVLGLSTGLIGSITTFTGWIQKMVNLIINGHWVTSITGLLIGMELAQVSLLIGIDTANLLKFLIRKAYSKLGNKSSCFIFNQAHNNHRFDIINSIIITIIYGILWGGSVILTILDKKSYNRRTLWIACMVGPSGVWMRWFFSHLNGKGIGSQRHLSWLPIGTLLTNLITTCMMAALSVINLAVTTENSKLLIGGLKLGFLGCMSTVSAFVLEVNDMHRSNKPWRAYAYIACTLFPAVSLGTFICSIPIMKCSIT